ncbi:MAG: SdiA-regulated domain-containing protein [Vicinamibacteria bacterium]|jgi:uncharacterized protein YjiK|nr:SdiA-regulated domain-containing protein [Vicinamibacteria bacterium]
MSDQETHPAQTPPAEETESAIDAATATPALSPEAAERAAKKARKRMKKLARLRTEAYRPLKARERYRALRDTLDEGQELIDLGDHKARFALLIMGALNAVLFIVGTRTEVITAIPESLRSWVGGYLILYILMALYFFIQAIESLRPRRAQFDVHYPGEDGYNDYPLGLRFFEDILRRNPEAYRSAWRNVHYGQLNAELKLQAYGLAQINHAKYAALRRLYSGLQIMTLMTGLLLAFAGFFAFKSSIESASALALKHRFVQRVLSAPTIVALGDAVREPSGVAYHAARDRLYVVGDQGQIAELDRAGSVLWSLPIGGNIEDVAVHTPSGLLVLVAEKSGKMILFDPETRSVRGHVKMDRIGLLGILPGDTNQGFEGLAYFDSRHPDGDVFYMVHQRTPPLLIEIDFHLQAADAKLGGEAVRDRYTLARNSDLTAVTYSAALDRLLVIADAKDQLLIVRRDGSIEIEVPLPGQKQEGLAFDRDGVLWVADDLGGGLLRFDQALSELRHALGKAETNPIPTVPRIQTTPIPSPSE